jgi:hypothetical protein
MSPKNPNKNDIWLLSGLLQVKQLTAFVPSRALSLRKKGRGARR